jgi:lipopolysaccharide export system protein LptA
MKYLHLKHFLLIMLPLLVLISPLPPLAESEEKKSKKTNEAPIVINADSLEMDDQQKIVIFKGNVNAKEQDFVIDCEKMVLHYKDQSTGQKSETSQINIDKIIATGKVIITRPGGGLATAEKALYYPVEEKVVLTGKPKVQQGNDFVQGSKITLFLKESRSVVESTKGDKVRAVYFPRSGKGSPVDR